MHIEGACAADYLEVAVFLGDPEPIYFESVNTQEHGWVMSYWATPEQNCSCAELSRSGFSAVTSIAPLVGDITRMVVLSWMFSVTVYPK